MKEFDPKREFLFDYITVVAECTFAIAVIYLIMGDSVSKIVYVAILIFTAGYSGT